MAALSFVHRVAVAVVVVVGAIGVAAPAVAQGVESLDDAALRSAQAEQLRREATKHLHLRAFELLDELVYGWGQAPPFASDTAVVLADVTVPFGYGSGLEALIENHFADLVIKHPEARLRLAHCPACAQVIVHADPQGTVVSRGIDQPGAMRQAGADVGAKHAIFLDFEAEGSALVLRTRITTLDDELTIVVSKTLSSSTSSAALLRTGDHLVSADVARAEYVDALEQRGPIAIPAKLMLFQFAPPRSLVGLKRQQPVDETAQRGVQRLVLRGQKWPSDQTPDVLRRPRAPIALPREQLRQHNSHREDVGGGANGGTHSLLGRHVHHFAQHDALFSLGRAHR